MTVDARPASVVTVVGVGADGWDGLPEASRRAIRTAEVLFGSDRQLALIPEPAGDRVAWPSPLVAALPDLLEEHAGRAICVLASGDPMFHGIGGTLARLLGPERIRVLAASVLGLAGLCPDGLGRSRRPRCSASSAGRWRRWWVPWRPGGRLLVLSADDRSPAAVATLLTPRGVRPEPLTSSSNSAVRSSGGGWHRYGRDLGASDDVDPLNVIAVECGPGRAGAVPCVPGLPDTAYSHDGQLTKREIRALTLARLGPVPGQLLWDVGAGVRQRLRMRGAARSSLRAGRSRSRGTGPSAWPRIAANAEALGVPGFVHSAWSGPRSLGGSGTPRMRSSSAVVSPGPGSLRPAGRRCDPVAGSSPTP